MRHAEVHNPTDIVYGRLPRFRLSERGRAQADRAGQFLSTRPVSALYSSPLLRARETAAIVDRQIHAAHVRLNQSLIEVRTSYQGSPNSILKPGFSFYEPLRDQHDETMLEVKQRMLKFLQLVIRRHPGGTIVAISHGDPIAIMRIGLEDKELNAQNLHTTVYPARASVTQLILEPARSLKLAYFDIVGDGPT